MKVEPFLSRRISFSPEGLLANQSSCAILGYAIRWAGIQSDGSPGGGFRLVFDLEQCGAVLEAGQSVMIALESGGGLVARTAGLDAVLFEDGSAEGDDRARLRERMSAALQAERDLLRKIVLNDESPLAWLESEASQFKLPGRVARVQDPFLARYLQDRARFAADILAMGGPSEIREYAERVGSSKRYPSFIS